jgi:trehalose/maltose hydrolase-like predicted phosphorylase
VDEWCLTYRGYRPGQERLREALCTLGNGYFGTRGAAPESTADGVHYPGTYVAGLYNRLATEVEGRPIENESNVNVPNWLPLTFRIDDGPWFSVDTVEIIDYAQILEMRRGAVIRRVRFRDGAGRETSLAQRRIVHMAYEHLAALETTIRPENWSGRVTVRSGIDGSVRNRGVERYRHLADRHLDAFEVEAPDRETVLLRCRTTQSRVEVVQAARTRLRVDGRPVPTGRDQVLARDAVSVEFSARVERGSVCRVEKVVALFTSRDPAISEPREAALEAVGHAAAFPELLERHVLEWDALWRRFAIVVETAEAGTGQTEQTGQPGKVEKTGQTGDPGRAGGASRVLNVHLFHLLQVASPHTLDRDVGAPARGLHGEAYRGHIFWDELFVFPLLTYRIPEITREMLRYRVRRLPAARRAARDAGHRGAMFPWESASSGREEAQHVHLNPVSGRWLPDQTFRQRHINIAVAYNAWQFFQITDDIDFLAGSGAELIIEIARFWASIASYDPVDDRYDITGVVGPDEFHVDDPNWEGTGLRNNAYTNVMAAWVHTRALRTLDLLPVVQRDGLVDRLRVRREELGTWEDISRKLRIPFHDGVISQFQGYELLGELDWDRYRQRYGDIHRLDRLLEAEGDDVNRYRVSKQADVLMLFYLLSFEELVELFARLGYHLDEHLLRRTIDYYLQRTSHGSTLSRVVHAWVLARSDRRASLELFRTALETDIADVQGGTTPEGIHLGAMAATVDLAARGYSGMEVSDGLLRFKPSLPHGLERLEFPIYYHHRWITVSLRGETLRLRSELTDRGPVNVAYHDRVARLDSGGSVSFAP